MMINGVTFDFWNTLVFEERGHLRGRRLDAWAGILEDAGFAAARIELEAVFDATWDVFVQSWNANQQYVAVQAATAAIEQLGFSLPSDVRAALIEAFTDAALGAELHLTPHIADVLADLKHRGLRLGIVCDVGMTASHILKAYLDGWGVLGLFDAVAFSDEVGVYKPNARIFRHALAGMGGVEPGAAAHVGDLRRTDIAGARALGMTAVRYVGVFDDDTEGQPEGHHVVADHRQLAGTLGL